MIDRTLLPPHIVITAQDIQNTPPTVLNLLEYLLRENMDLRRQGEDLTKQVAKQSKQIEDLRARLNLNSSNSSRPPSTDSPYQSKETGKEKKKPGAKRGHKGHRQIMLDPTDTKIIQPDTCSCGNTTFHDLTDYYTHQVIELPEIKMDVTHFVLYKGVCSCCGKTNRALIPKEHRTGFGPRLSALIAEMAGTQADSRSTIQTFCTSVLGFPISLGAIQKVIDRVSQALELPYKMIASQVRQEKVNHIDETSWHKNGVLMWLWVMANKTSALFMIHSRRSWEAFQELICDWNGILVSDGYRVYCKWVGLRQTCLSHLIRDAKRLSENQDIDMMMFGRWILKELQCLCHMANAPPTEKEWEAFYGRLMHLIARNQGNKDATGVFARRLQREMAHLWTFLAHEGVAPTNNHAERMIRFGVLWRKCSQGTSSDKGNRWVERILTIRQTCRLRSLKTYSILVDAVQRYFKGQEPDLSWVTQY
jgi:transposase